MGHKHDFWEDVRFRLARPIGGLLTGVRSVQTDATEFVGYVEMSEEEFEQELHDMGFERNMLAYWKYIPGLGHEEGSWRLTEGDEQLHVILYDGYPSQNIGEERTYIFAHWEYRWDRHPLKHIRGVDVSDTKGVNRMRTKLNLASIPFYNDKTIQ